MCVLASMVNGVALPRKPFSCFEGSSLAFAAVLTFAAPVEPLTNTAAVAMPEFSSSKLSELTTAASPPMSRRSTLAMRLAELYVRLCRGDLYHPNSCCLGWKCGADSREEIGFMSGLLLQSVLW